jgi:hypothetical protein
MRKAGFEELLLLFFTDSKLRRRRESCCFWAVKQWVYLLFLCSKGEEMLLVLQKVTAPIEQKIKRERWEIFCIKDQERGENFWEISFCRKTETKERRTRNSLLFYVSLKPEKWKEKHLLKPILFVATEWVPESGLWELLLLVLALTEREGDSCCLGTNREWEMKKS